MVSGGFAEDEV
jgi:EF-hand domain